MATCCGNRQEPNGTFRCGGRPVAAYSWDGAPFLYKGKPGAAVCEGHEKQLLAYADKYPNLQLVERLEKPPKDMNRSEALDYALGPCAHKSETKKVCRKDCPSCMAALSADSRRYVNDVALGRENPGEKRGTPYYAKRPWA